MTKTAKSCKTLDLFLFDSTGNATITIGKRIKLHLDSKSESPGRISSDQNNEVI
jgi:hypothetical protein